MCRARTPPPRLPTKRRRRKFKAPPSTSLIHCHFSVSSCPQNSLGALLDARDVHRARARRRASTAIDIWRQRTSLSSDARACIVGVERPSARRHRPRSSRRSARLHRRRSRRPALRRHRGTSGRWEINLCHRRVRRCERRVERRRRVRRRSHGWISLSARRPRRAERRRARQGATRCSVHVRRGRVRSVCEGTQGSRMR